MYIPVTILLLISPMHATYPTHYTLLNLITLITVGEGYKSNFEAPQYPVFSILLLYVNSKVKVKLPLGLTKHHTMKT
jgi:hypothetical protein